MSQRGRPEDEVKTPFTFKLMVVLAVLYLGWRLVELLIGLFRWITS